MPDPNDEQIKKQREKFVKAFDDLADATSNLAVVAKKQVELINKQIEAVNKQVEITNGMIDTMMMPKDGMRDVLDEAIDEIRGLRDDLRSIAKTGGLATVLAALNQIPRRR